MKLASVIVSTIVFTMCVSLTTAQATIVNVEGVPIKIGDTVENVQQALNTNLEPEKNEEDSPSFASKPKQKSELRLKTKGIWVFFQKGKVYTIRIDKPFSGNVGGVKLGDPSNKIEKTFGPPIKVGTFGRNRTYTYYFDDITTTRFDVNQDDEVETILFLK